MSINWDGFLMGLSDFGQERLKEERQKKMQAQLLELKEKYELAAEERAEKRANSKVDNNQTLENFDPATGTGTVQKYNPKGELLSESALSPGRIAELQANARKVELDNANTQSQIDARKEQLNISRASLDVDRERNSLTRRGLESQATAAEPSAPPNDVMEFVTNIMGFKAPTAGDAVGNRNWLKLQAAAEQALRWGELNNVSPENVKQRFRLIAGDPDYLETFGK